MITSTSISRRFSPSSSPHSSSIMSSNRDGSTWMGWAKEAMMLGSDVLGCAPNCSTVDIWEACSPRPVEYVADCKLASNSRRERMKRQTRREVILQSHEALSRTELNAKSKLTYGSMNKSRLIAISCTAIGSWSNVWEHTLGIFCSKHPYNRYAENDVQDVQSCKKSVGFEVSMWSTISWNVPHRKYIVPKHSSSYIHVSYQVRIYVTIHHCRKGENLLFFQIWRFALCGMTDRYTTR